MPHYQKRIWKVLWTFNIQAIQIELSSVPKTFLSSISKGNKQTEPQTKEALTIILNLLFQAQARIADGTHLYSKSTLNFLRFGLYRHFKTN